MSVEWERLYAARTRRVTSSAVRDLLEVAGRPEVISFAGGLPAPELFPADAVAEATDHILRDDASTALQYGATEGYRPLRVAIADRLSREGAPTAVDNVLITTGSQQALDLLGRVFLDEGDTVAVESPTYLGALQAWRPAGATFEVMTSDLDGVVPAQLETVFAARPKLLYLQPNFQNPRGVTLTEERRGQVVEVARRAGIVLVEDDPYHDLRYEGVHLPRLLTLSISGTGDLDSDSGGVISLGSFSKVLAPGLRVGWIAAPRPVVAQLARTKQGTDLHTATLNQMIVQKLLIDGQIDNHLPTMVRVYRERRDAMLNALAEHFPPECSWTRPSGGMFIWVTLPSSLDATAVLTRALREHVAFVPGAPFYPDGQCTNSMRLNFTNASPLQIEEGVSRLGRVLGELLDPRVPLGLGRRRV